MEWLSKHVDTVIVLAGILGSVLWMNGKFNEVDKQISKIEQRLVRIETVLIMRGLMPQDLVAATEEKKEG